MKKRSVVLACSMVLLATCVLSVSVLSQPPKGGCIDFKTFSPSTNPNPWVVDGVRFGVYDHAMTLSPNAEIVDQGGWIGLNCDYSTRIFLPHDCSSVEATLVHTATPATVRAYTIYGSLVGTASMSGPTNMVETLKIAGTAIRWVVIEAPNNETLLLEFCYSNGLKVLPKEACIEFNVFSPSTNPNPWVVDGVVIEVFDYLGAPVSNAEIVDWGGWNGLNCDYSTRIFLPHEYSSVEATLVHFVTAARIEAYTASWTLVGTASMSGPEDVAETLKVNGKDIRWVVIEAPQDETLLLEFCYSEEPSSSGCLGTAFITLLVIGGSAVHFRKK